jgi:V/A-type H+-transporting ATPase subunit D
MAKIKLTKNELKKQKDALRMYERYLPTLLLKKQQLQIEIRGIEARKRELDERKKALERDFRAWIGVFGDAPGRDAPGDGPCYDAEGRPLIRVLSIRTAKGNVAGVEIPLFDGAEFALAEYDLYSTPLWVDAALLRLREVLLLDLESEVLDVQVARLGAELKTTTQRVNLFEKVKIPETEENIRIIRIYLGDQQTAQVVRGKIAKRKVMAQAAGGGKP